MTTSVALLRAVLIVWSATIAALAALGFAGLFTPRVLTGLGIVVVLVAGLWLARSIRRGGLHALAHFTPLENGLLLGVLAMLAASLLSGLHKQQFIYDALSFHSHFPASWLQAGRLHIVSTVFGDIAPAYNPSNTELLFALFMAPLGSDALAQCGQLPFAALAALAVHATARELGAPRWTSLGSALAFLLIPPISEQTPTAMVDLALAATFLATLPWLVRLWRAPSRADSFTLALGVGLCIGTKFTAVAYLMPLAAVAGAIAWRHRDAWLGGGRNVPAILMLVMVSGGFWYLRNWIVAGNPFYPVTMRVAGVTLFRGVYDTALMRAWRYHFPIDSPLALAKVLHSAGVAFALASALAVGLALRRRRWLGPALVLSLAAVFWLVIPYQHSRFLFPMFGVLAILLAVESGANQAGWLALFIATAGSVMGDPTPARIFIVASVGSGVALSHAVPRMRVVFVAISALAFMCIVGAKLYAYPSRFPGYSVGDELDEGWVWIWDHVHGETVAYAGMNLPFPLTGRELANRVVYANVALGPEARLHDFDRRPHAPATTAEPPLYREGANFDSWSSNLGACQATTLVISTLYPIVARNIEHDGDGFPIERAWADAHSDRFTLRFANARVRIYEVRHVGT